MIATTPRFFMLISLYFFPFCLAFQNVHKFCCTIHGKDKQFHVMLSARKSIFGENIISCREFSLSTPKTFEYISSYKTLNSMPLLSLPEFAFIGRSNVGKSSLLNTLTGAKKNVATQGKTPGTTKCINLFSCGDKSGPICTFVDLPGYGFAKLAKTVQDEISRFLRDYFLARGALKLVFLLVDSRREGNTLDQEMFSVSFFKYDHHFNIGFFTGIFNSYYAVSSG
jgi:ribosome biogenesis GTP-binding protein YsxC/EngB